jgi:NADH:ubiquinone oxidoreductase subunit K
VLILITAIVFALGIWQGLKTKSGFYLSVIPFSLIIIILAAIEAALGLCFIMLFFSRKKTIQINNLKNIKF